MYLLQIEECLKLEVISLIPFDVYITHTHTHARIHMQRTPTRTHTHTHKHKHAVTCTKDANNLDQFAHQTIGMLSALPSACYVCVYTSGVPMFAEGEVGNVYSPHTAGSQIHTS